MDVTVSNQLFVFLSSAICGIFIGLIFDVFRIVRRIVKTGKAAAVVEDIAYWIIAAAIFFLFAGKVNSGEIRLYFFIGALLGTGLYFVTVSRYVIKVSVCIINFFIKIIGIVFRFLMTPVLFVFKLIGKPFFFVINLGKKNGRAIRRKLRFSVSNFFRYIKKI